MTNTCSEACGASLRLGFYFGMVVERTGNKHSRAGWMRRSPAAGASRKLRGSPGTEQSTTTRAWQARRTTQRRRKSLTLRESCFGRMP